MRYNTHKEPLKVPELGRGIQEMVKHLQTIENKTERTEAAKIIAKAIACIYKIKQKKSEEQEDIWDQIFLIANYDLDIDIPFQIEKPKKIDKKDIKMNYPPIIKNYRYYGNNIRKNIDKVLEYKDHEKYGEFILNLANNMKKLHLTWNELTVEDDAIMKHLKDLSNGEIDLKTEGAELKQFSQIIKNLNYQKRQPQRKKK